MEPLTEPECQQWAKSPNINPRNARYVKNGSMAMENIRRDCDKYGIRIPDRRPYTPSTYTPSVPTPMASPVASSIPVPSPPMSPVSFSPSARSPTITPISPSISYRDRVLMSKPSSVSIPPKPGSRGYLPPRPGSRGYLPPRPATASIPPKPAPIFTFPPLQQRSPVMSPRGRASSSKTTPTLFSPTANEWIPFSLKPGMDRNDEKRSWNPDDLSIPEQNDEERNWTPKSVSIPERNDEDATRFDLIPYGDGGVERVEAEGDVVTAVKRPEYDISVIGEIIRSKYRLLSKLGSGSYGTTYLASKRDSRLVAIKIIDREAYGIHENIGTIEDEIETLKDLSWNECEEYIVCYLDSFTEIWHGRVTTFIVMEYINGKSLREYRNKKKGKIRRSQLIPLMYQLLLGLKSIHQKGYAHRDIKPANIMFSKSKTIKYIDFGFACLEACRDRECNNICRGDPGTLIYNPPEHFNKETPRNLVSAQAHDIWSLGIVFYGMTNKNHYPVIGEGEDKKRDIKSKIKRGELHLSEYKHDFFGRQIDNLINDMLTYDWRSRPNINDILDTFIRDIATRIK